MRRARRRFSACRMGEQERAKSGNSGARTDHPTLFLHNMSQISENLIQFMNASLDLADLALPFGDQGFLELELGLGGAARLGGWGR